MNADMIDRGMQRLCKVDFHCTLFKIQTCQLLSAVTKKVDMSEQLLQGVASVILEHTVLNLFLVQVTFNT